MAENNPLGFFAELLNQIPLVLKEVENLSLGGWLVVILLVLGYLFKNSSHILDLVERRQKKTFERLDAYLLSKEGIDHNVLKTAQDVRNAHYFKIATGIYAENVFRDGLVNLHELNPTTLNWNVIGSAVELLDLDANGRVYVKPITRPQQFYRVYNICCGFLLLGFALLTIIFMSIGYINDKHFWSLILGTCYALIYVSTSIMAFRQNLGLNNSLVIAKELTKSHSYNTSSVVA